MPNKNCLTVTNWQVVGVIFKTIVDSISDTGRSIVDDNDGIPTLLSLLQSLLTNNKDGTDRLRTIACGFLLNVTNTNGKCSVSLFY